MCEFAWCKLLQSNRCLFSLAQIESENVTKAQEISYAVFKQNLDGGSLSALTAWENGIFVYLPALLSLAA